MTDPVHVYGAHQSSSEAAQLLATFWPRVMAEIRNMDNNHFKTQDLPLARIKKIMKQDEEVKMISAEAPVLFSKAAEIFISELSLRAWIHTEDNKRRTLQRNDIALAITKYDQFDFLIDIVPRDELKPQKRQGAMVPEQVQYYLQLAQMQQTQQPTANQNPQVGGVQVAQVTQGGHAILAAAPHVAVSINPSTSQPQIIQIQPPDQQQQHQQQQTQQQQQHQQVQAATHVQSAQQATQAGQQPVQLHVQPGAADLQQYAVQLASGAQMQYRLVPQIIQQPGGPPVVQLQAQPHQLQQTSGGQTVIAVQPAQSQQDGQQQSAEVNYSQIYQLAAAQGGGQGSIFITTHSEQTQDNQQETQPTE